MTRVRVGSVLRVQVHVSFALAVLAAALAGLAIGSGVTAAALVPGIVVLSLFVHELAHALAACGLGFDGVGVELGVLGGRTRYAGTAAAPHAEVAVAAAGPAASAALACVFAVAGDGTLAGFGAWVNLIGAVANLLPLPTLDGGQILGALRRLRRVTSSPDVGSGCA